MLYILFYEKSAKIHLISVNLKMMWPEAAKKIRGPKMLFVHLFGLKSTYFY